ncbi:lipoprotein [Guyparkeria sp. 1SP6A2]|nr:lipoprotein [Guyparkeria sp. 1SP6A2]
MPNPLSFASAHRPLVQAGILLVAAACLAGCGQKGPLYLPADEPVTNADNPDDAPGDNNDSTQD